MPRVADTQKCIRAGGKHNDLEDVGFDTYHHTFFEMLGNWSFGDYFKREAIEWAWELLVEIWKFPPDRLYATVYHPGPNEPAEFDSEAHAVWSSIFQKAGLNPEVHIINGGKKDNFWMMGETGPCGPCSELHMDLTPKGNSFGNLVNADSHLCIEIWNLVFIQFNADQSGRYTPLTAKHVDTGMGFERVAAVMQATKGFTDFSKPTSNYETDVFSPIFEKLSALSGKTYGSTLPESGKPANEQEEIDVAFRVIADHLRALCFSIADGIIPGNSGRNYVLRRILRRGIRYGRNLGFQKPFFHLLAPTLIRQMNAHFPELKERDEFIVKTVLSEEESFNKTLDRGIDLFQKEVKNMESGHQLSGTFAFKLYDTYGFPLDLTELLARESGFSVDCNAFEESMNEQRKRARKARKEVQLTVQEETESSDATEFVGYELENLLNFSSKSVDRILYGNTTYLIFDKSPFYAEMGGQVGDSGMVTIDDQTLLITNVVKDSRGRFLHALEAAPENLNWKREACILSVDLERRQAIQRHHTATHILHWALRKVLGDHVRQAGSLVQPTRLRFDFSHFEAVKPDAIAEIERLSNEKILINDRLRSYQVPFSDKPEDVIAFFGDKYGDIVRVVDLGGWSLELCAGTHVYSAGEIGSIRIIAESAISAGTRRMEAVAGLSAYQWTTRKVSQVQSLCHRFACKPQDLVNRITKMQIQAKEVEKRLRSLEQQGQSELADQLIEQAQLKDDLRLIKAVVPNLSPNDLRCLAIHLSKRAAPSVVLLASEANEKFCMVCICTREAVNAGHEAGKYLGKLAEKLGGKGGGKPDFAMGGAPVGKDLNHELKNISFSISSE